MDFVAVKIGDVTGDAVPGIQSKIIEPRTAFTKVFDFTNEYLQKGETVKLDFRLTPEDVLAGLQFTLTTDPASFVIRDLQSGTLTDERHFNQRFRKEGTLTFSWNTTSGDNWSEAPGTLFTLELEALRDGTLAEALSIHSRYTQAIALRANGQSGAVTLNFTTPATAEYHLGQNYPNPFDKSTIIGFRCLKPNGSNCRYFL